jgi:hypothetical protein
VLLGCMCSEASNFPSRLYCAAAREVRDVLSQTRVEKSALWVGQRCRMDRKALAAGARMRGETTLFGLKPPGTWNITIETCMSALTSVTWAVEGGNSY